MENEDKNKTTKIPEAPKDNNLSIVEEAEKLRDEIRAENDRRENILAKEQELHTRQMLGGHTQAGQIEKQETEEEKYIREAKSRYEGTGMDPTPDDSPTIFL